MAKKSNKTEHVLKLITKNDEDSQDDFFAIEKETSDKSGAAVPDGKVEKPEASPKDINVKPDIESKPSEPQVQKKKDEPAETSKVLLPENHADNNDNSAYMEQHDHLVNIAEILAKEKITLVMEKMKVCNCPTCINDVLALTLNSLPTKYVTTDAGKQYFQLDIYKKQYETDVLAALTKACVRVKASPRH
ncbi:MAG: late competence development ComFB family protein [Bacillota bacterium]